MPCKKMNRKADLSSPVIITFVRLLMFGVALFFIIKFSTTALEAAGFGASNIRESFINLAKEINDPNNVQHQVNILLDPDTAIVGFSKGRNYRCYGCVGGEERETPSSTLIGDMKEFKVPADSPTSEFRRPTTGTAAEACKDSSCICLCQSGVMVDTSTTPYAVVCRSIFCQKLNYELYNSFAIGKSLPAQQPFKYNINARWQDGFMYARDMKNLPNGINSFALTGMAPNNNERIIAWVEKKDMGGVNYASLCPKIPCIGQKI